MPVGSRNCSNMREQHNATVLGPCAEGSEAAANAEYSDCSQSRQYLNDKSIRRSTSFKKSEDVASPENPSTGSKALGCTYFGRGFEVARPAAAGAGRNARGSEPRTRLRSMHKTATNWTRADRSVKAGGGRNNESVVETRSYNKSYVKSILNTSSHVRADRSPPAGAGGCLPVINIKNPRQQFTTSTDEPEKGDEYIKYIARKKNSRASAISMTRSKEAGGRLDRRRLVGQPRETQQETKQPVRAFNWNGIHFEVNDQQDGPVDSAHHMHKGYSKEMNLLFYNFNDSGSVQEPGEEHSQSFMEERRGSRQRGGRTHQNKTSMNFYAREERKEPSPNSTAAQSNDNGEDANSKMSTQTREGEEDQPQAMDRQPPPLTPITNNSTDSFASS